MVLNGLALDAQTKEWLYSGSRAIPENYARYVTQYKDPTRDARRHLVSDDQPCVHHSGRTS